MKVCVMILVLICQFCKLKGNLVEDSLGLFQSQNSPKIILHSPNSGDVELSREKEIYILFDQAMNMEYCITSFGLEPRVEGKFSFNSLELKFIPEGKFPFGSYKYRLTKDCESEAGNDLDSVYTIPFHIGQGKEKPELVSVVASVGNLEECQNLTSIETDILNFEGIPQLCQSQSKPIRFNFNTSMKGQLDQVSFFPQVNGKFSWEDPFTLYFLPSEPLNENSNYSILVLGSMVSSESLPMEGNLQLTFVTGALNDPFVKAFGLASQFCGIGQNEFGNETGGDWTSAHCFWDSEKAILNPGAYRFRGGDDGTGFLGSSAACLDVDTDNFRLVFSEYMDPGSVISALRLQRISPPSTAIRLSSWYWDDCSDSYPYGCRQVTVLFSESEASCNGMLFGNGQTGGDFNLMNSSSMPNHFPFYELRLETQAKSSNGRNLNSPFSIMMEAK